MKAISLLNIVPIAVGLGGCMSDTLSQASEASEITIDDPEGQADPPDWVRIRSISWAGSGCPAGSVAENLAPDFQAFTLVFDSYVAEIGPQLPLSLSRRNCQILIDLDFPQGWSYSVFNVDYRGFINLEPGVWGVQQSAYYFQGEFRTARLHTTLYGPSVSDYQIRDSLGLDALVWAPCGAHRALNINSAARVVNGSGDLDARGLLTTDSIDGKVTHIYGLQWRRCSPEPSELPLRLDE
jgi:hypothetical protein